jgi:hypothetical protein
MAEQNSAYLNPPIKMQGDRPDTAALCPAFPMRLALSHVAALMAMDLGSSLCAHMDDTCPFFNEAFSADMS